MQVANCTVLVTDFVVYSPVCSVVCKREIITPYTHEDRGTFQYLFYSPCAFVHRRYSVVLDHVVCNCLLANSALLSDVEHL